MFKYIAHLYILLSMCMVKLTLTATDYHIKITSFEVTFNIVVKNFL